MEDLRITTNILGGDLMSKGYQKEVGVNCNCKEDKYRMSYEYAYNNNNMII